MLSLLISLFEWSQQGRRVRETVFGFGRGSSVARCYCLNSGCNSQYGAEAFVSYHWDSLGFRKEYAYGRFFALLVGHVCVLEDFDARGIGVCRLAYSLERHCVVNLLAHWKSLRYGKRKSRRDGDDYWDGRKSRRDQENGKRA